MVGITALAGCAETTEDTIGTNDSDGDLNIVMTEHWFDWDVSENFDDDLLFYTRLRNNTDEEQSSIIVTAELYENDFLIDDAQQNNSIPPESRIEENALFGLC